MEVTKILNYLKLASVPFAQAIRSFGLIFYFELNLGTSGVAFWAIFTSVYSAFYLIANLNLNAAMTRFFPENADTHKNVNMFLYVLLHSLISIILLVLISQFLGLAYIISIFKHIGVFGFTFYIMTEVALLCYYSYFRSIGNYSRQVSLIWYRLILDFTILAFVYYSFEDPMHLLIILGLGLSNLITLIMSFDSRILNEFKSIQYNINIINKYYLYGIIMFIPTLGNWIINNIDRIIIDQLFTDAELAQYFLATRIGFVLTFSVSPFYAVYQRRYIHDNSLNVIRTMNIFVMVQVAVSSGIFCVFIFLKYINLSSTLSLISHNLIFVALLGFLLYSCLSALNVFLLVSLSSSEIIAQWVKFIAIYLACIIPSIQFFGLVGPSISLCAASVIIYGIYFSRLTKNVAIE